MFPKTKDSIQKIVVDNSDKKLIILEHCTGLGKSFSALKILHKHAPKKVLLLVSENHHKENWASEIDKFYSMYNINLLSNIEIVIECYASMKNYTDTTWDILIMDEAHHLSELRLDFLRTIKADKYIALSATFEYQDILNIQNITGVSWENTYKSTITLKQAISWGVIPEPDIYLIPLELDKHRVTETIVEEWGNKKLLREVTTTYDRMWDYKRNKKMFPNIRLIIKCTQEQKHQYYVNNIEYWKNKFMSTYQPWAKNKWLQLGVQRKRFLGEIKTKYVKSLLNDLKDKRYICYCASIEQANMLGGGKAIHSKNKDNASIFKDFQEGKIDHIFAVGMLTEGQNLKGIEVGIIVQLDGKERPFIQKSGRILRSESPQQYIFYYKGTRDEEYLHNILEGIDSNYVSTIENFRYFVLDENNN